jgi:hypothetical protein
MIDHWDRYPFHRQIFSHSDKPDLHVTLWKDGTIELWSQVEKKVEYLYEGTEVEKFFETLYTII